MVEILYVKENFLLIMPLYFTTYNNHFQVSIFQNLTLLGGDSQSAGLQKRNNNNPNRQFGSPIRDQFEHFRRCIASKCQHKSLHLLKCSNRVLIKERKVPSWKGRTGESLHSWTQCTMTNKLNRDIKHLSWGEGI